MDVAVSTILNQYDEDRCWSLYLSCVANPFSEEITFDDFLAKQKTNRKPIQQKLNKAEPGMNAKQIDMQVLKANKILSSCTPTKKGGA